MITIMKRNLLILICLLLAAQASRAQNTHFTMGGVIEFDKTVNMYAIIQKEFDKDNIDFYRAPFEAYKRDHPQFKVVKSTLSFDKTRTVFNPIPAEETNGGFFSMLPFSNQNNIVYTELDNHTSITQKKVFDETLLAKDSTRKINWKITSETRDIIGYKCRRANAIVMDSVYVVAFYTDEIPVSGGPESFTGLPGMILGVAIPHENVTWFATKISEVPVPQKVLMPATKGKPVNNKTLSGILLDLIKGRGDFAKVFYRDFML